MITFGKDADCNYSIRNSYIYRAMAAHGIENFTCNELRADLDHEVRDEDDQTELDRIETETIQRYNSIAPHGYNLNSGGSSFKHNEETIKLMIAVKTANIDNIRNPKLKGLPANVTHHMRNGEEELLLKNHPRCKHMTFAVLKYGTLDNAKNALLEFVKNLEDNEEVYKKTKKGNDDTLPPGVLVTPKGYRVHKQINKKNYNRYFNVGTPEEKKKNALDYLESIMPKPTIVPVVPIVEPVVVPIVEPVTEPVSLLIPPTDNIQTEPIKTPTPSN
jgi:hypothetical protein